ncbi:MAG: acyl-CoA/acyl-ACP dehydrogenase [Deltaproteobacteria bacterium]|nr:acyl-CoA/acyl-ACP dehydrogenase [Deltaproteobacteria bacterium]
MPQPKDFGLAEDEQMLRDSARKFLGDNAGIETLRRSVARDHREAYESPVPPSMYDAALWRKIVELGWTSLAVPESMGGAGMKMVAVAALAEEAGRAALVSPLITTLLATCVLREAGTEGAKAALQRIAGGEAAALAITNADGSWEPGDSDVTAKVTKTGATLSGSAHFVQDARKVSFFVVAAKGDETVGLYVVDADTPGVTIHPDRIVDLTRDQAHVSFDNVVVPAQQVVAPAGLGDAVLRQAMPALLTVVAADMCGAGEWQLQTTTAYAQMRKQFDRPIGFFQAVKHPLVNMMVKIDEARSLVYAAACDVDSEPARAELHARMAKASASDMAAFCSGRSVQLHGGIGFTWECDVHIYFKRQIHNQMLFGDGIYQRAKLAELIDRAA